MDRVRWSPRNEAEKYINVTLNRVLRSSAATNVLRSNDPRDPIFVAYRSLPAKGKHSKPFLVSPFQRAVPPLKVYRQFPPKGLLDRFDDVGAFSFFHPRKCGMCHVQYAMVFSALQVLHSTVAAELFRISGTLCNLRGITRMRFVMSLSPSCFFPDFSGLCLRVFNKIAQNRAIRHMPCKKVFVLCYSHWSPQSNICIYVCIV